MLPFIEFLEEIERNNRVVVIESAEVERLVERFGTQVRNMGVWNHVTDGSVEISMSNIMEAVQSLDNEGLTAAVKQLSTTECLTGFLNSSSAAKQLIEALSNIRLQQFKSKVEQYQKANNSAESERLGREISQELFGT